MRNHLFSFKIKIMKKVIVGTNDLESWCKSNKRNDLLTEWDVKKNVLFSPTQIQYGSSKKVWWICEKGHSYEARISSRTLSHCGCPYCSGQKPIVGQNDFKTCFPLLASEWDYEKNYPIKPEDILKRSGKKFWWKCSKGHSYQASPDARAFGNTGCPICSHRKLLAGFNDLETTNPDVALEWDYEKNYPITPKHIFAGSLQKYWWICSKCGNSFQASASNRTNRHSGCPKCGLEEGKKAGYKTILKNRGSFADHHPELINEWDFNKNTIKPNEVSFSSKTKVWWICPNGHSYEASIDQRNTGNGCPYCSNHKLLKGYNDFATIHPELISEWHPTKNGNSQPNDFLAGSHIKAWWLCEFGHSWKAGIVERHNGSGCPECSKYLRTSFPEQAIFYYVSKLFPDAINGDRHLKIELDIFIPTISFAIEYDGAKWHQDLEKDLKKNVSCENHKIHLIRVREEGCPKMSSTNFVTVYNLSNGVSLEEIIVKILKGFNTNSVLPIVNIDKDLGKIMSSYKNQLRSNSFAYQYPELAKEWHPTKNGILTPVMFPKTSTKQIWWLGKCGHEWLASIVNRVSGGKCPICRAEEIKNAIGTNRESLDFANDINDSNNLIDETKNMSSNVIAGVNDLATINPSLALEWDYENNDGLTPKDVLGNFGDNTYSWICSKGHKWKAQIKSRMKGSGCPYCSGRKTLTGFNDFATLLPDLLKEWDYDKNQGISPQKIGIGYSKKVWWKCSHGHSYQALISNRQKAGCPYCSGRYPIEGVNDLETLNPEILKYWDYERNIISPRTLKPQSNQKVWWKCSICGYRWKASPSNRIKHPNCPRCSNSIAIKVINVDTGEIFSSISKATQKYGKGKSSSSQISNCCKGLQEKAFGYRWKYAD